jgi:hypothetical protein
MLRVGQDSKGVNQESGGSEERVESFQTVGVLAPVQSPRFVGIGGNQKGSRTRTKHADSAL